MSEWHGSNGARDYPEVKKGSLTELLGKHGTDNKRFNGQFGNGFQPRPGPRGVAPLPPPGFKEQVERKPKMVIEGGGPLQDWKGALQVKEEYIVTCVDENKTKVLTKEEDSPGQTVFKFSQSFNNEVVFNHIDFLKDFMKFAFPGLGYNILKKC